MPTPPTAHPPLFAVSALLLLPLTTAAQFTGVTLPPRSGPSIAEFSTTLGEALEIAFTAPDELDGSFGALDHGFGTYLAPRRAPLLSHHPIYFNPRPSAYAPDGAAARGTQFFLAPESSLLAFSSPVVLRDGRQMHPAFDSDHPAWPAHVTLPY